MSVYHSLEWRSLILQMRANPDDHTIPLIAADWLDELAQGKHRQAEFIRGCVGLHALIRERNAQSLEERQVSNSYSRLQVLYNRLRPLIHDFAHEWTGGNVRKWQNPTAHDWRDGFLRAWRLTIPNAAWNNCEERDKRLIAKLTALLLRQPITHIRVEFSWEEEASVTEWLQWLSEQPNFEGVEFYYRDCAFKRALPEVPA